MATNTVPEIRSLVPVLAAAFVSSCAFANDTMLTLAAGGLAPLKSTQVAMESEDLEISVHRVSVTYRFRNRTDHDIDATVGFPLPPIHGGDLNFTPIRLPSKDPVNFVNFKVTVDGAPVKTEVDVRALFKDRDVTARLRSFGLSASVVTVQNGKSLARLTPAQRAALKKGELIDCEEGSTAECYATWESRIQYHWAQRFPAGRTVTVQHTYEPVVGGSYIVGSMDGKSNISPFCGGASGLAAIAGFKKRHPGKNDDEQVLWENRINYILTTANNWSGPIGTFRLSIATDSPEDLVFTCFPGLKRAAPTRYQLERSGFRPDREFDVLILTSKRLE